jgi:hypothetical protein
MFGPVPLGLTAAAKMSKRQRLISGSLDIGDDYCHSLKEVQNHDFEFRDTSGSFLFSARQTASGATSKTMQAAEMSR